MTIRTDIGKRLAEGRQLLRAAYKQQDAAKLGVLRAGNTGIMSVDGEVAGACHRVAHLRQLGIELDPPDDSSLVMFQVGTSNEDIVYRDLVETAAENEVILREEEIPIEWFTANGTKVTGRPDMVICERRELGKEEGDIGFLYRSNEDISEQYLYKPLLLLELKSVASVWTSRSVLGERDPKLSHLAQAAHYMWKLGNIPGRLIYKQYAIQEIPGWTETVNGEKRNGWTRRLFPKPGKFGSEYIDYEKGRIRPFELVYTLRFSEAGVLEFKREHEPETDWTETVVTTQDIERFYSYVSTMEAEQKIGPKPLTLGAAGDEKSFSNCSYCPLNAECRKAEKLPVGEQYVAWLTAARKLVADREDKK